MRPAAAWGSGALGVLLLWYFGRYGDAPTYFFHFDDFWLIADAEAVRGPVDVFRSGRIGFVLYRPFSQVGYFSLLAYLFGHDPAPYHLVQVLAHVTNAFLVYGIAAAVLRSRPLGIAAALLYAAQPGHAIAVYWLALYSMTGTATWYLACLWVWIARGRSLEPQVARETHLTRPRWWAAFGLFGGALLCGEHAVSLPIALGAASLLVLGEPLRLAWRSLWPFFLLGASYAAAKVLYMSVLIDHHLPDPMVRAIVRSEYQPLLDPLASLRLLGFYVGCALGWLHDASPAAAKWYAVGIVTLLLSIPVVRWARRAQAGRDALFGMLLFGAALGPVLLLPRHAYPYYVGTAGAGFAIAAVAAAAAVPRRRGACVTALVVLVLAGEVWVGEPRTRADENFAFFHLFQRDALRWLDAVVRIPEEDPSVREVVFPQNGLTQTVFADGRAHRILVHATVDVRLAKNLATETPAPEKRLLPRPPLWSGGTRYPGARPAWDWLRWRDPWASE